MSGDIEVLHTTESAADAAAFLAVHDEDSVPLCQSDGSLAGAVTGRDILAKVVAKGLDPRQIQLAELAEPFDAMSVDAESTVEDAVQLMARYHRTRLPVTEGNRVIGVVTRRDAARCLTFRPTWGDLALAD
jgi:CBS domain-containing protein